MLSKPGSPSGTLEFRLSSAEANNPELSQPSPDSPASDDVVSEGRRTWIARLIPALVAALFLFVVAVGLLVVSIGQVNESRLAVASLLEVQGEALNIRLMLRQAESYQRGFLLTADEGFLEDYRALRNSFPFELSGLDRIVASGDQQARLDTIARLAKEKFEEMDQTIMLAQSDRRGEALAIVRTRLGKNLMTEISDQFEAFLATTGEATRIQEREAESRLRLMWGFAAFAGIATIVLAVLVGVLTRAQIVTLRRSEAALQDLNRELEARVVERTYELEVARDRAETLLRDVNHRVGNNLALVSSFLGLQMRAVADEASRRALASARNRVHTIATTQRKLRLGGGSDVTRIDALLREVIHDLVAGTQGNDRVAIDLESDPLAVPADDAVSVSVIVSELVMNAMKYAFPADADGRIVVRLRRADEGALLTVEDNGVGKAEPIGAGSVGLGSQIVFLLCRQFGGEPSYESGSGAGDRRGLLVIVPLPSLNTESQQ